MMYNTATVLPALRGLIGFRDTPNTQIGSIADTLKGSTSGRFYNDLGTSELLTLKNLHACYDTEEYSSFSDFLTDFRDSVLTFALDEFIRAKQLQKHSKSLLEDAVIWKGASTIREVDSSNQFYGWLIRPEQFDNVVLQLHQIAITLDDTQAALTLYLYHSSKQEPLQAMGLTDISGYDHKFFALTDWLLPFAGADTMPGGSYYLGYYEEDLTARPVSYRYDFEWPCLDCNGSYGRANYSDHKQLLRFAHISPFVIDNQHLNAGRTLFDVGQDERNLKHIRYRSLGMTARMSVKLDITDFIARHPAQFTDLLLAAAGVLAVRLINGSTEQSGIRQIIEGKAYEQAINAESISAKRLKEAIESIDFNLSGLNNPVFPQKMTSITRKSV